MKHLPLGMKGISVDGAWEAQKWRFPIIGSREEAKKMIKGEDEIGDENG